MNTFGELRFNNANSFGTGPITFGSGHNSYEITSGASFQAMTFNNAVTGPWPNGMDAELNYTGGPPGDVHQLDAGYRSKHVHSWQQYVSNPKVDPRRRHDWH